MFDFWLWSVPYARAAVFVIVTVGVWAWMIDRLGMIAGLIGLPLGLLAAWPTSLLMAFAWPFLLLVPVFMLLRSRQRAMRRSRIPLWRSKVAR